MRPSTSALVLLLPLAILACEAPSTPADPSADPGGERLAAHAHASGPTAPTLLKVTDGIWMASGFGLSNQILLEGPAGAVVVDTGESLELGRAVRAAFAEVSTAPIVAIVYTHNHADHVFGAEAFAGPGVEIVAHCDLPARVENYLGRLRPAIEARSARMFGTFLSPEEHVHAGIGPVLRFGPGRSSGYLPPTRTFADRMTLEVAGIRLELLHLPGETPDQIGIWWADKRAVMVGDNFYWALPNLYTLRGTSYRDLAAWARSLETLRDLGADFIVPSHNRPLAGAVTVATALESTRDAVRYLHDQGIRAIAAGATPDEMVHEIALPPHLAEAAWLQPFYGRTDWALRALFAGTLGWFDGDAAHIAPLPPAEQATLWVEAAGGAEALKGRAAEKLAAGEAQAAIELIGPVLRLSPDDAAARSLRVRALRARARGESNPNARHWYFAEARELEAGRVLAEPAITRPEQVAVMPLSMVFEAIGTHLDGPATWDLETTIGWDFGDADERWLLIVRRGVAETRRLPPGAAFPDEAEVIVETSSTAFKEMLAGLRNPAVAAAGFHYPRGNAVALLATLRHFRPGERKLPALPRP